MFYIKPSIVCHNVPWMKLVLHEHESFNYGGIEVQNKSQFWKQNNKLQTQMQI